MLEYVYESGFSQEVDEVVAHRLHTGQFTHGHPCTIPMTDVRRDPNDRKKVVKKQVEIFSVKGLVDGKLNAQFFPVRFNKPVILTEEDEKEKERLHPEVYERWILRKLEEANNYFSAVHWVSCKMDLGICPMVAVRDFGREDRNVKQSIRVTNSNPKLVDESQVDLSALGPGILVPEVNARSLLEAGGGAEVSLNMEGTTELHVNDALAFDFLIGSGQFLWAPYCVAPNGTVFSTLHFRAFSYSSNGRMASVLRAREGRLSMDFVRKLVVFIETPMHLGDLIKPLIPLIGTRKTDLFEEVLNALCNRRIGDHVRIRPVERDDE